MNLISLATSFKFCFMYMYILVAVRVELKILTLPPKPECSQIQSKIDNIFSVLHKTMKSIASCLPNVFVAANPVSVQWGKISVLDSDLTCQRQLWNHTVKSLTILNII